MENIIEREWNGFVQKAFRPNLPEHQLRDLKRTFFAGVAGTLAVCSEQIPQGADEDRWLTERVLQICAELHLFNEDVKAGRA